MTEVVVIGKFVEDAWKIKQAVIAVLPEDQIGNSPSGPSQFNYS